MVDLPQDPSLLLYVDVVNNLACGKTGIYRAQAIFALELRT